MLSFFIQNALAFGEADINAIEAGVGTSRIDSLTTFLNGSLTSRFGIVSLFFFVGGALFVIYLTFAGIKLMTSAGDPKAVSEAQQMITNALIGLMVVIFAYWIVQFIGIFLGLPGVQSTF